LLGLFNTNIIQELSNFFTLSTMKGEFTSDFLYKLRKSKKISVIENETTTKKIFVLANIIIQWRAEIINFQ
jgi:soluble P-type ATPase